jgi:hypothetical protein
MIEIGADLGLVRLAAARAEDVAQRLVIAVPAALGRELVIVRDPDAAA